MSENISSDKIKSSPIEVGGASTVPVGPDPFTRDPIIDQKMGLLGRIFGFGDSAHLNIAGLTLVLFALLLTASIIGVVVSGDPDTRKFLTGIITPIFGVITGGIGFVVGKKDK